MNKSFLEKETHRADCYRYLSAFFYQPDKDLFQETNIFQNLNSFISSAFIEAIPYVDKLQKSFAQYSNEDLLIDYSALFLGPFELKAPPYGSVYLEKERRLMGDTTLSVMEYYQRCGLTLDDEFKEAPDHITAELEFISYLSYKAIFEIRNGNPKEAIEYLKIQNNFVDTLVAPWVSKFCKDIKDNAKTVFYHTLSDLLLFVIENTVKKCHNSINTIYSNTDILRP